MEDNRDYLERIESISEKLYGEKPTQDEIVNKFSLYGIEKRAAHLDQLEVELSSGDIDGSDRKAMIRHYELSKLRKQLGERHAALRKAKR